MTAPETVLPAPQQYLTMEELCARLKIGRTKLYELRRQLRATGRDDLEPVRLGTRSLRWPEDRLPALVAALEEAATLYTRDRP